VHRGLRNHDRHRRPEIVHVVRAGLGLGRDVRRQHDAQGGQLVALPRVGRVQETLVVAAPPII
jgi:hypothetical protein